MTSEIPLISSFLDIFCYQYGYVDETNALAWRRVWKFGQINILMKQYQALVCSIISFTMLWASSSASFLYVILFAKTDTVFTGTVQTIGLVRFVIKKLRNAKSKMLYKLLPCDVDEGYIAIDKTPFVQSKIANPNYHQCPLNAFANNMATRI